MATKKIKSNNSVIIRPKKEDKKEVKLKGELPEKAYCYHCTIEQPYILKSEKITELYKGEKVSFSTMTPYCNHCGNPSYIYNLDQYNKDMAKFIYENKRKINETKTEIDFK